MVVSPVPLTPCLPAPASLQPFERVSLPLTPRIPVPSRRLPSLSGKVRKISWRRDFHEVFLSINEKAKFQTTTVSLVCLFTTASLAGWRLHGGWKSRQSVGRKVSTTRGSSYEIIFDKNRENGKVQKRIRRSKDGLANFILEERLSSKYNTNLKFSFFSKILFTSHSG